VSVYLYCFKQSQGWVQYPNYSKQKAG